MCFCTIRDFGSLTTNDCHNFKISCDLWQSCGLTNPNIFKSTDSYMYVCNGRLLSNFTEIDLICIVKSRHCWTPSQVLRHPNVKTLRTGQYKALKAGDSDLDNTMAVNSSGKSILTACLSVCMCECVRASKSVCA